MWTGSAGVAGPLVRALVCMRVWHVRFRMLCPWRRGATARGVVAAAFCLKNTADNMIEVALQQSGCADARAAAARALVADKQSAGVIRVAVRELEGVREHAVFLGGEVPPLHHPPVHSWSPDSMAARPARSMHWRGNKLVRSRHTGVAGICWGGWADGRLQARRSGVFVQGFVLQSLKLLMKVHQRRNKRRADAIDDSALLGSNVLYAMVDPHSEWIASVIVLQSEAMLKLQLQHSQSVLAQSAAVQALSAMVTEARRGHKRFVTQQLRSDLGQLSLNGVQELLTYVLNNKDVFYR